MAEYLELDLSHLDKEFEKETAPSEQDAKLVPEVTIDETTVALLEATPNVVDPQDKGRG